MTTAKRSVITIELENEELEALTTARDLLYEISALIKNGCVESATDWNAKLDAEEIQIAQHVLKILINNGDPSDWEMEE